MWTKVLRLQREMEFQKYLTLLSYPNLITPIIRLQKKKEDAIGDTLLITIIN